MGGVWIEALCSRRKPASWYGRVQNQHQSKSLGTISASWRLRPPQPCLLDHITLQIHTSHLKSNTVLSQKMRQCCQISDLSLLSAPMQRDFPYRFKQLNEGVFTTHSSYGTIQLSHFSGNAVTGRKRTPRLYCVHLYHTMKHVFDWRFYIPCHHTRPCGTNYCMSLYIDIHIQHTIVGVLWDKNFPESLSKILLGTQLLPCQRPTMMHNRALAD